MIVSFVAALDRNRVIGANNDLPWRIPADSRHFMLLTLGKPVIMGRRTFDSIGGKPLPRRRNIVVTRARTFEAEGCTVVDSIEKALEEAAGADEVMVAGGAAIYAELLPRADRMYLTLIDAEFEGDTHFPAWNPAEWVEIEREQVEPDQENPYRYAHVTLERKR